MIVGYFGKPRSGKTTQLASYVSLNRRRLALKTHIYQVFRFPFLMKILDNLIPTYDVIYSNEFVAGTVAYDTYSLGLWKPAPNSLILIHEAGTYFNNRNYKSLPSHISDFWAKHGHYFVDIVWDSQTVDVDIKLRQRTHKLYVVRKIPFGFSLVQSIRYWIGVNPEQHKLDELYSIATGFFGTMLALLTFQFKLLFRRKYYKLFNSHSQDLKFKESAPTETWSSSD